LKRYKSKQISDRDVDEDLSKRIQAEIDSRVFGFKDFSPARMKIAWCEHCQNHEAISQWLQITDLWERFKGLKKCNIENQKTRLLEKGWCLLRIDSYGKHGKALES